jgi:hypothetical protein
MITRSDARDAGRLTDGELRQQFDIISASHHTMHRQCADYKNGNLTGAYDDDWFIRLKAALGYSYEEKELLRSELRKRELLVPPPPPNENSRRKIQERYTCLVMAVKEIVPPKLQQLVWDRSKEFFDNRTLEPRDVDG